MEPEVSTKTLSAMGRAIERLKAKKELKIHTESVLEGIKQFKCNICEYTAWQKSDLKKHIGPVHESIQQFKCKICDHKAAKNSQLKIHIKSVHEGIQAMKY